MRKFYNVLISVRSNSFALNLNICFFKEKVVNILVKKLFFHGLLYIIILSWHKSEAQYLDSSAINQYCRKQVKISSPLISSIKDAKPGL
jgi:hypothetical protein